MINRREVLLYAKFAAEFSELFAVELRSIIRHNLLRYAKSAYYCLPYKVLNLLTGDRGQRLGFYPLCEISDSYHDIFESRSCRGRGQMRSIPHTAKGHGNVIETSFSGYDLGIFENL